MPSVGTVIAQPKSKKLVNTQNFANNEETGPYFFLQSAIDSWYNNNTNDITKVTETVYIVKDGVDFKNLVGDINYDTTLNKRRTYNDMGKTLYIGNTTTADLIVMQRIQIPGGTSAGGGAGAVGYVVLENNCDDTPSWDAGRLVPRVARV